MRTTAGSIRRTTGIAVFLLAVVWPALAGAQVPQQLEHQGRLLNASGEPVSGSVEVTFTLYDAKEGGSILWEGTKTIEVGDSGYYSTRIGSEDNPITPAVLKGGEVYLGVKVGDKAEMTPRLPLRSSAFALRSSRAGVAGEAETVAEGAIEPPDLAESFQLPAQQVSGQTLGGITCQSGQIARWNGTNWSCADLPDQKSDEDVVDAVEASGQFAGSGQTCGSDKVVSGLGDTGGLVCKPDATLSESDVVSAAEGDFAHAGQNCQEGMVVAGVGSNGEVDCVPQKSPEMLAVKKTEECNYTDGQSSGWYGANRTVNFTKKYDNSVIKVDYYDRVGCEDPDDQGKPSGDWCGINGRLLVDGSNSGVFYAREIANNELNGCGNTRTNYDEGDDDAMSHEMEVVQREFFLENLSAGDHDLEIQYHDPHGPSSPDNIQIGGTVDTHALGNGERTAEARLVVWEYPQP